MGISALAAIKIATMLVIIQEMPRAERGIGALTIAVDGHWNSRMAGSVGSFLATDAESGTRLLDAALLIFWPVFGASARSRKPYLRSISAA